MNMVFLLGAARSGTTLLGDTILSRHPDIIYMGEPKFLWDYGNAFKNHDILTEKDLKKYKTKYIYKSIKKYINNRNYKVFLEKTPSNCFRLRYLNKAFPKAKFIHVIRDGRDVAISSAREWRGKRGAIEYQFLRSGNIFKQIFKSFKVLSYYNYRFNTIRSILEIPAYTSRLLNFLRRKLFHDSRALWGPRYPALKAIRRNFSLLETCAIQWDHSVRSIKNYFHTNNNNYLEIRYEDLVNNPILETNKIFEFLELEVTSDLSKNLISSIDKQKLPKYTEELNKIELNKIESLIGFTLSSLGY